MPMQTASKYAKPRISQESGISYVSERQRWQGWFVHMSSHLMKQGHVKKNLRISSYMPLGKQQSSAPAAGQIWAGEI